MAFSLGNIIKNAGSTILGVASPAFDALTGLAKAGSSAISSLLNSGNSKTTNPTASPSSSLFSVAGNPANGVIPQGASATVTPPSFTLPQTTSVQLKSSTPTTNPTLTPLATSTMTPTVPTTISSNSLNAGGAPITTVSTPTPAPASSGNFSSTAQAGGTPTTTASTTISPDLLNPTSDKAITDTQGRILDVKTQLQGKTAALNAAEVQAKVPEQQQQLNDVMSQINTLNNDAVAQQVKIEGKPIASEFQSRQIAAVERARVVKVLGLSAVASALQGNIALAKDYAQKATDAKFAPLEAELETLQQQLEFNKDNFTRAEKARADKLSIALDDRKQALADARTQQDNINSIALEAAKNGADADTLNKILGAGNLAEALGTARGALAAKNGIGIYGLSEAQANIASKLADDFEKATGSFTQVRDAYGKIQAAQSGTGIADTALIFAYMKLLDPTSVVREGEFATVQNAGGVPQKLLQAYNGALNGEKLVDSVRKQILDTSGDLYAKAQTTQNQIVQQYNERAMAYGIPTNLVTRDVSAGIGGAPNGAIAGATQDTIYAKLKAKYPDAPEDQLRAATQKYLDNPDLQKQLGFTSDLGTSVNAPTAMGVGFRTDRHNNPTAFTTDVARAAGLKEGVDYVVGDAFPNNPSLKTARLLGDPIDTTIRVIDNIGFQTSSGKPRWDYINIPKSQWDALSYNQKKSVIAQMYAHEGGNKLQSAFA